MTKKRFTLEMQYWKGNPQGRKLFDNVTGQNGMSIEELCNIASDLHDENQRLKGRRHEDINDLSVIAMKYKALEEENKKIKAELQRIYNVSTVHKVKSIVDEIYDDLLYETSEESDYARKKVLQCLEKIEDFGDGLND